MWALGVTMYQVVTGEHPFTVHNEEMFRREVLNGWIDWSRVAGHPKLQLILQNLMKVNVKDRWTATQTMSYAQNDFIVDIQRLFRGFKARKEVKRIREGLVKIQAHIKGKLTRNRYKNAKVMRKDQAATMIQARWRAYVVRKGYLHKYKCIQRMQANILTRNYRRVFLDMRKNTQSAQAYIKRFLAMLWYSKIRKTKDNLETHIASINQMIENYNVQANDFQH